MKRFLGVATFRRNERGAALVEFTLALPLLVLLIAGLTEFGVMLNQQQVLAKSVRDAGRYAARTPFAFKTCPLNAQGEWATLVSDTKTLALRGSLSGSAPFLIANFNNVSMVTVVDSCAPAGSLLSPAGGGNDIPVITVTATVPYGGIGFLSFLGISSLNLTAEHKEMWVGL